MSLRKTALGRGLDALLPAAAPGGMPVGVASASGPRPDISLLPTGSLQPNPGQPRQHFDQVALKELADSIRTHGILQPIAAVRRGKDHIIVAGERRWRAAMLARIPSVPVTVLDLTDQQVMECALVENLQREDLNPLEEARAYRSLIETFGVSQDVVAERVGISRAAVANAIRLLKLETDYQRDIETRQLTAGHARALLSLSDAADRRKLRDAIVAQGLTVRAAEAEAARLAHRPETPRKKTAPRTVDPNVRRLREALVDAVGCRVDVHALDKKRGRIEIHYESPADLERFLSLLNIEL